MTETLLRIKLRFLPNVTKFRVSDVKVHAKPLLMGVVKKQRAFEITRYEDISKRNAYLNRSYRRLKRYAVNGQYNQFETLAKILIRSSRVYQLTMLSFASSDWYTKPPSKILKLWRSITRLRDRTDLKYERWWIDKKPGDAARPIGAPKLHWKVNMLKYLQIFEIFYLSRGIYPDWQHAGISNRGLVSAWTDVLTKAFPSKFIYEFDIKGFFDNIHNQNAVIELPELNARLNKMVNSLPSRYHLPETEKDSALQEYLRGSLVMNKNHSIFDREWKVTADHGPALFKEDYVKNLLGVPTGVDPAYIEEHKDFYKQRAQYLVTTGMGVKTGVKNNVQFFASSDPMQIAKAILASKEIENSSSVMNIRLRDEFTEKDRALERDRWKGLGRVNHGFPQGANFSPFLSCLVLGKALQNLPGLIMYMDDGLLYADTRHQLGQRIRRLKERLATIGLSLAQDKCRMVREEGNFYGIKFLGIRATPEYKVTSETRSGTKLPVELSLLNKEQFEKVAAYYDIPEKYAELVREFISDIKTATMSEKRVTRWAREKAKDPVKALNWAAQEGFISNIIAKIFDPEIGTEERRQLAGEIEKLNLILRPNSLSELMVRWRESKDPLYLPDIQTISTDSVLRLMKVLRKSNPRVRQENIRNSKNARS